jgi:hypothetical protein
VNDKAIAILGENRIMAISTVRPDGWQRSFAWLPVTMPDGQRVWLRHVEWRIRRLRGLYFEIDYRLPPE